MSAKVAGCNYASLTHPVLRRRITNNFAHDIAACHVYRLCFLGVRAKVFAEFGKFGRNLNCASSLASANVPVFVSYVASVLIVSLFHCSLQHRVRVHEHTVLVQVVVDATEIIDVLLMHRLRIQV